MLYIKTTTTTASNKRRPSQTRYNSQCASCLIRTTLDDYSYEAYIIDSAKRHAHQCGICRSIAKKATIQKWVRKGLGVNLTLKTLVA